MYLPPVRGPDWQPAFEDPEIQAYLEEVAGTEGLEVFKHILENEPTTGEDIVEGFPDRKPSDVRKVLYKLMQAHALEYDKSTDAKGWETFHWATDLPELKLIHERRWVEELADLRQQLKFEEDHEFYACPNRHRRVIFEEAMDTEFKCPVCAQDMQPIDASEVRTAIRERIDELAAAVEA